MCSVTDAHDVDGTIEWLIEDDLWSVRYVQPASKGHSGPWRRVMKLPKLFDGIQNEIALLSSGVGTIWLDPRMNRSQVVQCFV